jgi:glycosyltransferase involved in cell wall biosynthesis
MISIVIPVFNQHDMTKECLRAVIEHTKDYEIVVVDNGSTPPVLAMINGQYVVNRVRNESNNGFPVAVNQGIRAAQGEIIVVLNNDVIVTPGWAEKLCSTLDKFSIVGPVTNYCAGIQRVYVPEYRNEGELRDRAEQWRKDHVGKIQEVNFVIGFCMAFRRSLIDDVGYFDESRWPCCGEEVDFCYRARAAGHKIGIVNEVYVHHFGGQTFQDLARSGQINYNELFHQIDEDLKEKYGDYWTDQIVKEPEPEGLKLNLGCGYRKLDGYVNIDNRIQVEPDQCLDILDGLPFDDNSVSVVRAYDFLEHIPIGKTVFVMEEIWRVLKPGGLFESMTPDAEHGQGAFQDPTHVSFWVENSWKYFSGLQERYLYGIKADFEIESIERQESAGRVYHLLVNARARK